MRRYVGPLVGLTLALIALTGCSDGAQPAGPPPDRPFAPENVTAPPSPGTWLAQVCSALASTARAGAEVPTTDQADLAGSRDRMIAYLDERARGIRSSIDGVNAAGPAPVEGGGSSTDAVLTSLRERLGALREARESLAAVPANATETLLYGLQRARANLVERSPAALQDLAIPAALQSQAASVPSCRALTGS